MKKLLTYITAAALIFSLGSCSEEEGSLYDFTLDPSLEVTFAAENLKFNNLTEDMGGKISVPMYRGNTAEAASVPVTITGGEGILTPSKSSFDFAAGENVAYIDFTFDYDAMSPAPVTISIVANNAEDVSDNGYGQTQFSLQKQLSYNPVGIITYESGFLMTAAGAPVLNREIQKAEEGNYFLIPDAWTSGTDFSFYFDGQNLEWYSKLKGLNFAALRYFNAAGYDVDGKMLGLERNPANLIPIVMEAACGIRPNVLIFGNDYPTEDGTGVRDYVHVTDLADAHVKAADYIMSKKQNLVVNLGSEKGLSVMQIVEAARRITGKEIPAIISPRRPGDPAKLVAASAYAKKELGWSAKYSDLDTIISSTWKVYEENMKRKSGK